MATETIGGAPTVASVREALRTVIDPEAGMNIVDLGLVYRIDAGPQRIAVDITLTTRACPMGDMITGNARDAILVAVPGAPDLEVRLVWEPPWDPSKMSARAKQHFGWSAA
jgi:metal-sulfur cluster biosynthetic enzyme